MAIQWWLRLAGLILAGLGGWMLGLWVGGVVDEEAPLSWGLGGMLTGGVIGLAVAPYLVLVPIQWTRRVFQDMSFSALVSGTLGLILGLVVAALISASLSRLAGWPGVAAPAALSVVLGLLGMAIMLTRERDISQFLPDRYRRDGQAGRYGASGRVLMDTSAIIDGRIADISKTGFVAGTMVIPRFVLDELRHIADSSDPLRRTRGRRGLEMLNKLRNETDVPIQILDEDVRDVPEVDGKLVMMAKNMRAPILTTDFNLNRVAELQGVRALNVNELANALKPVVIPGEEMMVRVIQEGREIGQGVAFLDDGTMVVIEGGKKYINSHLDVSITRVLQTAAGRIIFAQPSTT